MTMEAPATVKSAMRTLDILEFLVAEGRPMAANALATSLAIPISSLSYLLATLVEREYLQRSGRLYAPGPALARLQPAHRLPSLADRVAPIVKSLRLQLNETAGFFVPRDGSVEALVSEIGMHALRYTLEVGQRAPLHAFSAGKAILATFDDAALERYFATIPREAYTPNTIVEEGPLRAELAEIRRLGLAHTRQEHTPGIMGVGRATVIDGVALGAFSIAVPVGRFSPDVERRATELLFRATDLLSQSCETGTIPVE
jgi:IclR family acetate operon transcriptional repressor